MPDSRDRAETPAPDSTAWLSSLLRRSPLLPDPSLRRAWLTLLPHLATDERYELAALLVEAEQRSSDA